ncbi:MAG TPA: creatininase family protein [Rhodopila sp.]|uniref:creatininase family protein n=1 Tax=Rhodopila sp. TaxID=2480087 RepID=UPI002D1A5CDB|nr:creatininase family protein [Rhodopila sp.]HVY18388.1 creatininase family protein [Rhodopila sp.]
MRIADMDWRMVEDWVRHDDRCILPLGSTEQHAGLSLATDAILAERVAVEAAEPLGIPVFPVVSFGLTPYFSGFPGTVTLRVSTFAALVRDVLDSLKGSGFRRILLVNGHGGNQPASAVAQEWMMDQSDARVRFHDWWRAPLTQAAIQRIDPVASHASWMENFPWTRLPNRTPVDDAKPMVDVDRMRTLPPFEVRLLLEDGNFGGRYQRDDAEMLEIWDVAVRETRALLEAW